MPGRFHYEHAVIERWFGPDELELLIDLGFDLTHRVRLRLRDVDVPPRGDAASRDMVGAIAARFPPGTRVRVETERMGKHRNYRARLSEAETEADVNDFARALERGVA